MEGWARETSLWDGSPHRIWDSAGVFPGPYRICLTWATYHSLKSNGELLPWPAPRSQVRPWRRMENYLWQMTLKREGVALEVVHLTYSLTTGGTGRSCLGHSCLKEAIALTVQSSCFHGQREVPLLYISMWPRSWAAFFLEEVATSFLCRRRLQKAFLPSETAFPGGTCENTSEEQMQ